MGKKTSIYLTDEIRAKLHSPPRGPSQAIAEIAERYEAIIAPEKRRLEVFFAPEEWNAMRNACNGTLWTAATMRGGVLADIEDSLDGELDAFGVSRSALENKLRTLSLTAQFALVELIEEFWEKTTPAGEDPED